MKRYVYADNAATTRLDPEAFEAMRPYLLDEFANASQPYSFSRTAKDALKGARNTIAQCINARPDEIFFTSGGTESDNWAIKGSVGAGQALVASSIEHHAVLNSCRAMERLGHPLFYVPPDRNALVSPAKLNAVMTEQVGLVSVMFANNEVGAIEPVGALGRVAHEYGALFHTDAVQAVGHVKVDVKALDVDLLSASAHKFHGPKGIGFLYVKSGTPMRAYLDGGRQERGLRAGTENIASVVGMATALKNSCKTMQATADLLTTLENALLEGLYAAKLDFLRNAAEVDRLPGVISLSFPDADGEVILHRMDLLGVCVSTGAACDSEYVTVSHVLQAIGVPEEYARGTIRVSLGGNNTIRDVETIVSALRKILCRA